MVTAAVAEEVPSAALDGGEIAVGETAPSVLAVRAVLGSCGAPSAEVVGMPPQPFLRILRFRRALCRARGGAPCWAEIAEEVGYFDQAHLIADFRAMAGTTPAAWQASRTSP